MRTLPAVAVTRPARRADPLDNSTSDEGRNCGSADPPAKPGLPRAKRKSPIVRVAMNLTPAPVPQTLRCAPAAKKDSTAKATLSWKESFRNRQAG